MVLTPLAAAGETEARHVGGLSSCLKKPDFVLENKKIGPSQLFILPTRKKSCSNTLYCELQK
jgi:hypothetical protein